MKLTNHTIEPYIPRSWFDPDGARILAARLAERCPNLLGKLFITLEVDPWRFKDGAEATRVTRDRIRRMFFRLRQGVQLEDGRIVHSSARSLVKVEFGTDGEMARLWGDGVSDYPHYHIILNTHKFIPWEAIQQLWTFGSVKVQRIDSHTEGLRYLLKYSFKPGAIPQHILMRKQFRVVQSSRGFFNTPARSKPIGKRSGQASRKRSLTIRARINRWQRLVHLRKGFRHSIVECRYRNFRHALCRFHVELSFEGEFVETHRIALYETANLKWLLKIQPKLSPAYAFMAA